VSRLLSHRLCRICLAFALLAALFAPQTSSALDDPDLDYYTLETDHFYIHYYTGLENFARRVARVHEEAHQILSPLLDWTPADKTHVVLTDKSDTANGAARAFGRNRVLIYTMPPEPEGVLGYYDDWLRILVYHEYVHVLHLDTASEEAPLLNMFIGKQVLPNQVSPRWYVEGLATLYESRRTGTGRVNSSLFQMWLRTAALEDRFFALGTATGSPVEWPMGSASYLYGSFFLDYVTNTRGKNFPRDFNHLYGSRLIPFSLNQAAEEVSGSTFHQMWKEWTAHVMGESLAKRVAVQARGRTPLEQLTDGGGSNRFPRQQPGRGRMSFYRSDLASDSAFSLALPNGRQRELFTVDGASGAHDWTPDGQTLVYARRAIVDNVYSFNDLFARDIAHDRERRITRGERAREPAVSPDGERVAYVRNLHGTMELVVRTLGTNASGDAHVLAGANDWPEDDDGHWQQISMPTWRPDGRALAFSWWRLDTRQRDLWLYDFDKPEGQRLTQLTDDASQELTPYFDEEGRLYFASDRTGVFNIYLMEVDEQRTWQLSNVVNGVFDPRPSADGTWIYVSTYTKDGYELARFRRPTRLWHPAPESAYTPARRQYPEVDESTWSDGPYRPLRWLGPLTLQPEGMLMFEGAGLGGALSGYGPLDRHSWQLSGAWVTGETSLETSSALAASYSYGGLPFNLGTQASVRTFPRSRNLIAESRYVPFSERSYSVGLSANYPIRTISEQLRFSTASSLRRNEFAERPSVDHEPADFQPSTPEHGWSSNVRFGLLYTNLERYPQSISLADGLFARLSVSLQHDLGDPDINSIALTYGGGGYLSVPWFDHHVLALQLNGGIIRSNFPGSRGFAIGGYSPQDILTDLILQEPRGQFVLRGFPPGFSRGTQYQVWKGSYRFPLANLDQGFSTVPVFFRRAKGAVFVDAGGAFEGYLADADFLASAGAEVQVDAIFGYMLGGTLRLGFARGLTAGGVSEWYLRYGGGF
jgi:Tol biopolymer transport system component